jgi:hypothetical protein
MVTATKVTVGNKLHYRCCGGPDGIGLKGAPLFSTSVNGLPDGAGQCHAARPEGAQAADFILLQQ